MSSARSAAAAAQSLSRALCNRSTAACLSAVIAGSRIDGAGLLLVRVGLSFALLCCPVSALGGGIAAVSEGQQPVDVDIALGAVLIPQISDHVPAGSHPAAPVGSTVARVRGIVALMGTAIRLVHSLSPLVDHKGRPCIASGSPRPRHAERSQSGRRRAREVESTEVGITARVASVTLPAEPASARAARSMLGQTCAEGALPSDLTDTAQLLTSELVTNVVIHGRSPVTVTTVLNDGLLRVEVSDDNSRHPQLRQTDDSTLDGRGLHIVALLAARWGVIDEPLGKTVWFELAG